MYFSVINDGLPLGRVETEVCVCLLSCQFGSDWFLPTEASHLRTSIQEQLQLLFEQEEKERGMSNTGSQVICNVVAPSVDLEVACE